MTIDTDAIYTRLQLCNAEIIGASGRALKLPPTKKLMPADLPLIYMQAPRGMTDPTARTSAGQYIVRRRFEGRLLVARSTVASLDSGTDGSYLLGLCLPWLDALVDYYMEHPRLQTDADRTPLAGLSEDISFQDTGAAADLKGPDGEQYAGIGFVLTIAERRQPSPARLA